MRALVGSEGSTGAVNGARKEMLAKLRAESGTSSRSAEEITVLMVLLVVSRGWLASEGPRSLTSTDSCTHFGLSVTARLGSLPTATTAAALFPAKPQTPTVSVSDH